MEKNKKMEDIIFSLTNTLDYAETLLNDDIRMIGYLLDYYFCSDTKPEGFEYQYRELQILIYTLFKSMNYNLDNIKKDIEKCNVQIQES